MTMLMSHLSSRNQLPTLLQELGLTGDGVEVGTHRGDYARLLLSQPALWNGNLVCVDPWEDDIPGYEVQAEILKTDLEGGITRDKDYREARRVLSRYGTRSRLLRTTSTGATRVFNDGSWFQGRHLDFVYIDGNHAWPHPYEDMIRWWPLIHPGGVLAGHDFICPGARDGSWGRYIQRAVHLFATAEILNVYLIVEEGGLPWSYYIIKPK